MHRILLIAILFFSGVSICKAQHFLQSKVAFGQQELNMGQWLNLLSAQANFDYSYNPALFNQDMKVAYKTDGSSLAQVLDYLGPKFGFAYKPPTTGKHLFIKPVKRKRQPKQIYTSITGTITDVNTGTPLPNVSVELQNYNTETTSGPNGQFNFTVANPSTQVQLLCSKNGYLPQQATFRASQQLIVNMSLSPQDSAIQVAPKPVVLPSPFLASLEETGPLTLKLKPTEFYPDSFSTGFGAHMGVVPGLSLYFPQGSYLNTNLSFNLLGINSFGVEGFQLGALANANKLNTTGLQVASLSNTNAGELTGLSVSGISNITLQRVLGVQVGGILAYSRNNMTGLQAAGIYNHLSSTGQGFQVSGIATYTHRTFHGLRAAGIVNLSNQDTYGILAAGISNLSKGRTVGACLAGIVNTNAGGFTGLQAAGIGNFNKRARKKDSTIDTTIIDYGLQTAGIFNYSPHLVGSQIGLINIADTLTGVQFGLINIAKNGYHRLAFEYSNTHYANASLQLGQSYFFNRFEMGFANANTTYDNQDYSKPIMGYGVGGGLIRWNKKQPKSAPGLSLISTIRMPADWNDDKYDTFWLSSGLEFQYFPLRWLSIYAKVDFNSLYDRGGLPADGEPLFTGSFRPEEFTPTDNRWGWWISSTAGLGFVF